MPKPPQIIRSYSQKPVFRYFVMSFFLVILELASFAFANSVLGINYLIATPVSLVLVITLNWYLGRLFVFTQSKYRAHTEFLLVAFASVVGIGIQLAVVFCGVKILGLVPFFAKVLAIGVTFFWNFFVRQKYIFR